MLFLKGTVGSWLGWAWGLGVVVSLGGFAPRALAQTCPSFYLPLANASTTTVLVQAQGNGSSPWPEERQESSTWVDAQGDLWLYGGFFKSGGGQTFALNNLWKYTRGTNPSAPGWVNPTPVPRPLSWPPAVAGAMTWSESGNALMMFGGSTGSGYSTGVWRLNPSTLTWNKVTLKAGSGQPAGRTGTTLFQRDDVALFYGGQNETGVLNQILQFSTILNSSGWHVGPGQPDSPSQRSGAASWTDLKGRYWVFGGYDGTTVTRQLWTSPPLSSPWTNVSPPASAPQPSARRDAKTWVDRNGDLMLYGGFDGHDYLNDAWKFTLNSELANPRWVQVSEADIPPEGTADWPAAGPAGAWTTANGAAYLLDGQPGKQVLWKFDFLSDERLPISITTPPDTTYQLFVDVRNFVTNQSSLSIAQQPVHGTVTYSSFSTDTLNYRAPADWTGTESFTLKLTSPGCADAFTTVNVTVAYETTDTCSAMTDVSASPFTPAGSSPPPRRGMTSWTDGNGDWWIWGGRTITGTDGNGDPVQTDFNELWQFTRKTEQENPRWINRTPASGGPAPQYRSLGWTAPDGDLWLIQGHQMWRYSLSTHTWIDMTPASIPPGPLPDGNYGAVSWTDRHGDFWLLTSNNSTLWKYPIATQPAPHWWARVVPSQARDSWPNLRAHAMAWTDLKGNLWLFGGQDTYLNADFNDLWKYDPEQPLPFSGLRRWERYNLSGRAPGDRIAGATWTDVQGDLWLYGGHSDREGYLEDLWQFTLGTEPHRPVWRDRTPDLAVAPWPGPRYMQAAWTDENGHFWSYGGAQTFAGLHKNDLWKLDPSGLTQTVELDINTSATVYPFGSNVAGDLTLTITAPPAAGIATIITAPPGTTPNAIHYTPPPAWTGTDTITIQATSAHCQSITKTLTLKTRPAPPSRVEDYELY